MRVMQTNALKSRVRHSFCWNSLKFAPP